MEPLAKPSGVSLADHTRHVREEVARVLAARPFTIYKYAIRTGQNLLALADACARWHDMGKQHPKWQDACRKDYAEGQRTGKVKGENLRKAKLRHEFASLVLMRKEPGIAWLPPAAYAAVAAHHGKLGHRYYKRWNEDATFLPFREEMWHLSGTVKPESMAEAEAFERAIGWRYAYGGLRAVLRLADHRASAQEEHDGSAALAVPKLAPFKYHFPWGNNRRGVQKLIPQLWDEPFALLRAPTGAGKTDAALLWAQRQVLTGRADRLVWAMPTRFTANALFIATTDTLSRTGLYHSSAWHLAQQREQQQPDRREHAAWRQELTYARLLETAATVTTLDQLCLALTATREDHHTVFWNLAHSCVVIDEADFYDDFTQRNLVVLLRALRLLQVPVLLMSATLPESARELYGKAGLIVPKIWDDPTGAERTRLLLHRAGGAELPTDPALAPLLERGRQGEPLIIYANTVGRAQAYLDWFRAHNMPNVVLYHSRFAEPDKEQIEGRLLAMLGPAAWAKGKPTGVAILTQIGELSVNISADLMVSDLCPTDRLAQRAGRLSRFTDRYDCRENVVGELHVVEPEKTDKAGEKLPYPAPYGHYRQGQGWEMSVVLQQSNAQLVAGTYSARRFVTLVNELYPSVAQETNEVRNNRQALEKAVVHNWLLLPEAETDVDDDTPNWKSRDIGPQKVVYVGTNFSPLDFGIGGDPTSFANSFAFQEWALPRAITVPVYDFVRARHAAKITEVEVLIGDEQETIWVVKSPYYDAVQGLRFDQEPSAEDE